ncbi:tape measure protein [Agrobacterium vitis]|uniref:tape measure protein n=1 Tax=Agrobacterium vitis TaxID=373 RepID=UPI0012E9FB5E|nr:tape measure protein [Agrobacterium vitis]MUO83991.1 tape measure protein [Agrobacterium vitis]
MATDVEKLVVQLSADIKGYQREMQKAAGITNRQARAIENRYQQMDKRLGALGSSAARGLIAPLTGVAAAITVDQVLAYADAWTGAKNSLAVAGVVGENQVRVLDKIYQSAQNNAAPVGAMAELFGKASQAADNLGASQTDLLKFTDGVGTALRVEGKSAAVASGALTQLGQLLGSARVQAEEFNSVNEGARPILIAVANGLDAAGGSVNKLKQLVNDGKVSGQQFFQAFLKGLPTIEAMAANATQTIEQGVTKVTNAFTRYIGQSDESLGASQRLVAGLNALADNFDGTADVVLSLASVIAGALVGRSIAGMITKFGLATVAVTRLVAALRAASSMAGIATAIGGIGSAAAPLGVIIGGIVVGALALFASSSAEAAANAKHVGSELESMGLLAKQAAPELDKTSKSLDELTKIERVRKIRELNDEIDRLKGGGKLSFFDQGDEFGSIISQATSQLSGLGGIFSSSEDKSALSAITRYAAGVRDGNIAANEALAKLKEIQQTDISKPVLELNLQLQRSVEIFKAAKTGALALGDTSEIDRVRENLGAMRDELTLLGQSNMISDAQIGQIDTLIKKFEDGQASADETKNALRDVAGVNPNALDYVARLAPILDIFAQLSAAAKQAKIDMANATGGVSAEQTAAYKQYYASRQQGEQMVKIGKAYADEAQRQNSLSKDQLAVEKEIAKIKADLQKSGGTLPEAQIKTLAQSNVQADDGRSKSSKSPSVPKTADSRFETDIQAVKDRTAALVQEQQVIGQTYYQQEKRRLALDLEQQALADVREEARKKGDADWQNAKLTPEQISKIEAASDAYAKQADVLRRVEEAQQNTEAAAREFYDTAKSAFSDVIMGAESFEDALSGVLKKLGELALNSAFDGLLGGSSATSSGGWLTGIFKNLGFADGGYTGAGGKYEPAGVVHKGEYVFDADAVRKAGGPAGLDAMRKRLKGYSSGGYVGPSAPRMPDLSRAASSKASAVQISINPVIDNRGASVEAVARQEQAMNKLQKTLPAQIITAVRDARARGVKV